MKLVKPVPLTVRYRIQYKLDFVPNYLDLVENAHLAHFNFDIHTLSDAALNTIGAILAVWLLLHGLVVFVQLQCILLGMWLHHP
jgi:hypothetical protein